MLCHDVSMAKFGALWLAAAGVSAFATAAQRPPIVGIANIALKVSYLDSARKFYGQALGYQEAFTLKQSAGHPDLVCFKINDHQYIEVSPELKDEKEDRLIHIGFETADARRLRDYLAGKGIDVTAEIAPGADGNLSFTVRTPMVTPWSSCSICPGRFTAGTSVSSCLMRVFPITRFTWASMWWTAPRRTASMRTFWDSARCGRAAPATITSTGYRSSCPKARTGWSI